MPSIGPPEIVLLLIAFAGFALWVWALIDCLVNERGQAQLVWVIVILLANVVGAILYFVLRRPKRLAERRA